MQGVALLHDRHHRIGLYLVVLLQGHGFVPLRIEGLALRIDRLDIEPVQRVHETLQRQLDALIQSLDLRILLVRNRLQRAFQVVDHDQQLADQFFLAVLVCLFHILLGTTTHVVQLGMSPQHLFLLAGQLFLRLGQPLQRLLPGELFPGARGSLLSRRSGAGRRFVAARFRRFAGCLSSLVPLSIFVS